MNSSNLQAFIDLESTLDLRVTPDCLSEFVRFSGDDAPFHTDEAWACGNGFRGVLIHGALITSYISRFVGTIHPGPKSLLQRMDMRFPNPCYVGDNIQIHGRTRQVSESTSSVIVSIKVTNQDGIVVAVGTTTHLILN